MVGWFRTRDTLRRIASVAEVGRWLGGSESEILCGESPVLHSGVGGCVVQNQKYFAANRQFCRVRYVVGWFRTRDTLQRIASVA